MDLSALAVKKEETRFIEIEHPIAGKLFIDDKQTVPVTIEVRSPSSDAIIALDKRNTNAIMQRQQRNKEIDANFAEEKRIERLMAYTVSVNGIELNGEKITLKNIEQIYRNKEFGWLHEQIEQKTASWNRFLQD